MTDFFADLEREIRAAHPRRSRPVVPVKGIAAAAAVAATVVAVVLALGQLAPVAEREVGGAPSAQEGWTPYAPTECEGRVVDGRIPDAIVDRFAILRGDGPVADVPAKEIPFEAGSVVRQSLRQVEGPSGTRYVVGLVRLGDENCKPSDHGVCLISLETENAACVPPGDGPQVNHLVDELPGGRRVLGIIAADGVPRVRVAGSGPTVEREVVGNTRLELLPEDGGDPIVNPATLDAGEETIPLNCSGQPDMSRLEHLEIFRRERAAEDTAGIEVDLPQGWHGIYLAQARAVEFTLYDARYFVVPASDDACEVGVCLVAAGGGGTECAHLPDEPTKPIVLTLKTQRDADVDVAGLAVDGLREVTVTGVAGRLAASRESSVFFARVVQADAADLRAEPGS